MGTCIYNPTNPNIRANLVTRVQALSNFQLPLSFNSTAKLYKKKHNSVNKIPDRIFFFHKRVLLGGYETSLRYFSGASAATLKKM